MGRLMGVKSSKCILGLGGGGSGAHTSHLMAHKQWRLWHVQDLPVVPQIASNEGHTCRLNTTSVVQAYCPSPSTHWPCMRWQQVVLGWLDFLSNSIREKQYNDAPYDKGRHGACCMGIVVFLIAAFAYCTFLILTRPMELVSLANPSWQTVHQESQTSPVQCDCKYGTLRLADIVHHSDCPNSDLETSDKWELGIMTLAIAQAALYEIFDNHDVVYRYPIESWGRRFLLYNDHPNQSSWDDERANVALGKGLGDALMLCVENSDTNSWKTYHEWTASCGCTKGICATARYRQSPFGCKHALDALPEDVRAFVMQKDYQYEMISSSWVNAVHVQDLMNAYPDLTVFYRWVTQLFSMPERVATRLSSMALDYGSYRSDKNFSSVFIKAIEDVEREYHRVLKREAKVMGPLMTAMGNASKPAMNALKGLLGTMHYMVLLGLTKPVVDNLAYGEVLPGLVLATATVWGVDRRRWGW